MPKSKNIKKKKRKDKIFLILGFISFLVASVISFRIGFSAFEKEYFVFMNISIISVISFVFAGILLMLAAIYYMKYIRSLK